MSDRDFAMALAVLAEAFGEKHLTPVRIEAYHRGLKAVPLTLLEGAVQKAIATRTFFPKVSELLLDAELCRREIAAAHPWLPCCDCEDTPGMRAVSAAPPSKGHGGAERCKCKDRHLEKLAGLGVSLEPLALPPARREMDDAE